MRITKPNFVKTERALCNLLKKKLRNRRFVILTDETVQELCMPRLMDFLQEDSPLDIVEVEAGEGAKSPEVCLHLWNHLLELGITKTDVLVCVGGGSITDLGGFIAATFKRGIPCIFIPTTLLAMTDASIGGKNGVDSLEVKNVIGTIVQPESIIIFPQFCVTQERRQFLSGMAEVIKHAIIEGGDLWEEILQLPTDLTLLSDSILRKSVASKCSIVAKDLYELDLRRVLNLGHTIGHAIESACLKRATPLEHGLAIAAGLLVEIKLAIQLKLTNHETLRDAEKILLRWFDSEFVTLPLWEDIEAFLMHDKKVNEKKMMFALPISVGNVQIVNVENKLNVELSYNQVFKP
jgi:3-dehydroquinate synthase